MTITRVLHLGRLNFVQKKHLVNSGDCNPAEQRHVGIHQTHTLKHPPSTSGHHGRTSHIAHICCSNFPSDFRSSPSATAQEDLTGCNPSHAHFHEGTSGLFQGKLPYLLQYYVFLNRLTRVKMRSRFYEVHVFLKNASLMKILSVVLQHLFPS